MHCTIRVQEVPGRHLMSDFQIRYITRQQTDRGGNLLGCSDLANGGMSEGLTYIPSKPEL